MEEMIFDIVFLLLGTIIGYGIVSVIVVTQDEKYKNEHYVKLNYCFKCIESETNDTVYVPIEEVFDLSLGNEDVIELAHVPDGEINIMITPKGRGSVAKFRLGWGK